MTTKYAAWARMKRLDGTGVPLHPSAVPQEQLSEYKLLPMLGAYVQRGEELVAPGFFSSLVTQPTHIILKEDGVYLVHASSDFCWEGMEALSECS